MRLCQEGFDVRRLTSLLMGVPMGKSILRYRRWMIDTRGSIALQRYGYPSLVEGADGRA
jgi:hypothetical protein